MIEYKLSPQNIEHFENGGVYSFERRTEACLAQTHDEIRALQQQLALLLGLLPLKLSCPPTILVTGGLPMASGDPVDSINLTAINDSRIANRHVVVTPPAPAQPVTFDAPGFNAAQFPLAGMGLPAGTKVDVQIISQAPGFADVMADFPNVVIADTRPLAASGAPTIDVTAVEP